MKAHQFVPLDTETTGVDFCSSQVIQCGIVLIDTQFNQIFEKEWNINYKPDKFSWDSESEKIHGISKEEALKHGLEPEEFLKDFEKELIKHVGLPFPELHILGANSYFDFTMLKKLWDTYRSDEFIFSYRTVDISSLSLSLFNISGLKSVSEYLGIEIEESLAHSALYDAKLHLKVFKECMKKVHLDN